MISVIQCMKIQAFLNYLMWVEMGLRVIAMNYILRSPELDTRVLSTPTFCYFILLKHLTCEHDLRFSGDHLAINDI